MLAPLLVKALTILADDFHWCQERSHTETSSQDDGIKVFALSALAYEASFCEFLQAFREQFDVVAVQALEISGIVDPPLAAQRKVRHDEVVVLLWAVAVDVSPRVLFNRQSLFHLAFIRAVCGSKLIRLDEGIEPVVALPQRHIAEAKPFKTRKGLIGPLVIPLCAPSILGELLYARCDGWHNLGCTAAVTNNGDSFPVPVKGRVPLSGVEHFALETIHARYSDLPGLREPADGRQ